MGGSAGRQPQPWQVVFWVVSSAIILLLILVLLPFYGGSQRSPDMYSLSNVRQIVVGAVAYASDHEGQWPDTVDRFATDYLGGSLSDQGGVLANPRDGYSGYRYVPPDDGLDWASEQAESVPILWEVREDGTVDPNGCIGYAAGYVELPRDRSGDKK